MQHVIVLARNRPPSKLARCRNRRHPGVPGLSAPRLLRLSRLLGLAMPLPRQQPSRRARRTAGSPRLSGSHAARGRRHPPRYCFPDGIGRTPQAKSDRPASADRAIASRGTQSCRSSEPDECFRFRIDRRRACASATYPITDAAADARLLLSGSGCRSGRSVIDLVAASRAQRSSEPSALDDWVRIKASAGASSRAKALGYARVAGSRGHFSLLTVARQDRLFAEARVPKREGSAEGRIPPRRGPLATAAARPACDRNRPRAAAGRSADRRVRPTAMAASTRRTKPGSSASVERHSRW